VVDASAGFRKHLYSLTTRLRGAEVLLGTASPLVHAIRPSMRTPAVTPVQPSAISLESDSWTPNASQQESSPSVKYVSQAVLFTAVSAAHGHETPASSPVRRSLAIWGRNCGIANAAERNGRASRRPAISV
jgi:hypothetical protein